MNNVEKKQVENHAEKSAPKVSFYARCGKRALDIVLSGGALLVLSPVLLVLMVLGAIMMKGNPFFTQKRPGKKEKIFKMIKFRTMSNARGSDGKFLPDEVRLNKYGRFLRSTSLDELPELINIFKGDMSIVGPRPLAVSYLEYYTEEERHRHDVRPGLTGLAQISGRNGLSWEEKFSLDLEYIRTLTFAADIKIVFGTVKKVFKREGIGQGEEAPVSLSAERRT